MIKISGALLIIVCSFMIGKSIVNYKLISIRTKQECISFFKILNEQLLTKFNDISESIVMSCEKVEFVYKKDFIIFADAIQNSDNNTFKKAIENTKNNYNKNAYEIIRKFAVKLDENGFIHAQKAAKEMVEMLSSQLNKETEKLNSDNKIVINSSLFLGILIVIILL